MADRDNYRGYGSPSGRYYENREYGPGYGDRSRERERGGWVGDRDDRGYHRDRGDWRETGRDDNRGFFERAGDEIRSWFGDDDYRDRDRQQQRNDWRDRSASYGDRSSYAGRDRDFYRDAREPWGGGDTTGYGDNRNYGGSSRFNDRNAYGSAALGRDRFGANAHDESYGSWRQGQIDALDRDYDDYRRENRDRFHSEFSSWRTRRQEQRDSLRQVREHMDVIGSDGEHVGTVDKLSGDRIILTKTDSASGGHHHSIPCGWVQAVDDKVTINKTAEQAHQQWRDEENRRALFESEDQRRDDGPHILGRSFSGTYNYR